MNPFLPLDTYIPDGEPKVFGDRVYLYGSKDLFGGEYCCYKYHVYSAPLSNLQDWTDHGPVLASRNDYVEEGIEATIPWSDGLLWAPDVVERDGKYYLYFCQSDGSEGVAESAYPYGPFENPRQICMAGEPIKGIDPSVLQVGDSYYYTWGQGHCHMAQLNDDMCTLKEETYVEALITNDDGQQGFHEGSSLRKIGDWYCMVYASEYTEAFPNRGGHPTKLDYAVAKDIYGPYERRGTIINNYGVDPASWNNHGSIIQINGEWYVFYHGSSNNCKYTRRARVEKIKVDEVKGIITEAQMTSGGFTDVIKPQEVTEPAYAYNVSGGAYFTEEGKYHPLVNVTNGSSVSYRYIDFSEKTDWELSLKGQFKASGAVNVYVNDDLISKRNHDKNETVIAMKLNVNCSKADIRLEFVGEADVEHVRLYGLAFR